MSQTQQCQAISNVTVFPHSHHSSVLEIGHQSKPLFLPLTQLPETFLWASPFPSAVLWPQSWGLSCTLQRTQLLSSPRVKGGLRGVETAAGLTVRWGVLSVKSSSQRRPLQQHQDLTIKMMFRVGPGASNSSLSVILNKSLLPQGTSSCRHLTSQFN